MLPVYTIDDVAKFPKICLTGLSKSGKSYVASKIQHLGGHHIHNFSDPVVLTVFKQYGLVKNKGVTDEDILKFYASYGGKDIPDPLLNGETLRHTLLSVSAEKKLQFGQDFFLNQTKKKLTGVEKFVIPDLRFNIEAAWVRKRPDIKVFLVESRNSVERKGDRLPKKLSKMYAYGRPKDPPVKIHGLLINNYTSK